MSDEQQSGSDLPMGELREITLRIPGSAFFCETINLPSSLPQKNENKSNTRISQWDDYLGDLLNQADFFPYPAEQLAWGTICAMTQKKLLFLPRLQGNCARWVGKT